MNKVSGIVRGNMGNIAAKVVGPVLLSVSISLLGPVSGATQELPSQPVNRLAEIKNLYESAEYDRALAVVTRADAALLSAAEAREISVYEALCSLALGKKADAVTKIEALLRAEPLYQPSAESPNRLRALVEETRTHLRPELAQARYTAGKQLFDSEKYDAAVQQFAVVLQLTEGMSGSALPEFAEIRMLAAGFRDLGLRTVAAAPTPIAPIPILPPQTPAEPEVVPPVTVRQSLPLWPASLAALRRREQGLDPLSGVLEVVITPAGKVASAKLTKPIAPAYDALLLRAARQWKYQPATRNGVPIEYVKTLAINVR